MKLLNNLDLQKNQLLNAVVQNLSTAPAPCLKGQIYFDTDDNLLYICTASGNPGTWSVAGSSYSHPNDGGGTIAGLTGANVVSSITVNAYGHVTATATRALTPADIGASASGHDLIAGHNATLGTATTAGYVLKAATTTSYGWAALSKSDVGLSNVDDVSINSWAGSSNIVTVGTITTGTWNATAIADGKIASALTGKTYNGLTLTAAADGFTIAGGTTSRTLTVTGASKSLAGTGTGITLTGAYALTFTMSNTTSLTLPTTGTLATLAGTETLSGKTLTSPKFASADYIADNNGNELIKFPATVASATNEITVSNAANGSAPSIAATGSSDVNVNLNLIPKGTGVVQANGVEIVTISGTQTLSSKTLTAPKFASGGFIADANGNELIILTTTAAAVNEINITNGATGVGPTIAASGETNVDLLLTSKGSGKVKANGTEVSVVGHTHSYEPVVSVGTANQIWGMNNAAGAKEWKSFGAIGTSGTAPAWALTVANTITLNIPMASAGSVTAGLLSNTDYAKIHTANADTGTTSQTFQLYSGSSGVKLKDVSGALHLRNAADNAYADLRVSNLTVDGTTTIINSNTVEIGDNTIVLNADITTNAANSDGGIAVKRLMADNSTRKDALINFNNTNNYWELTDGVVTGTLVTSQIARKLVFDIGDATPVETSFTLTHNLNTLDVAVSLREVATGEIMIPNYTASGVNTVVVDFSTAPTTGQYKVVIIG